MQELLLGEHPHIDLCDLLKKAGFCGSGAEGKHIVASGVVKVDGQVELRKRAKIRSGQVVEFQGKQVKVV